MNTTELSFGPALYGAKLYINALPHESWLTDSPIVIDIETDEKDNFVGCALTADGENILYTTELSAVKLYTKNRPLIGHNLKGDMKWLINWGCDITADQLYYDTILASYVQNTTKESHGLKDLAKEYLGMEWPTYKEMVGSGKKKVTLDKQEIEKVAAYCGMDCLATYRLWQYFEKTLTNLQTGYLELIELPTARALLDMELRGVQVDVTYLKALDATFGLQLKQLEEKVREHVNNAGFLRHWSEQEGEWIYKEKCVCCGDGELEFVPNGKVKNHVEEFNINSNRQIAQLLQAQGAELPRTPKGNFKVDKATLEQWKHLPAVPLLLEYSKIEKLKSTYTTALLEKQKNGRIYCNFNQLSKDAKGNTFGISTGRLSSSNPNLQNIPQRTAEGKLIRKSFISGDNNLFVDADFSQVEYRLLAHFSQEKVLLDAYRTDKDLHEETIKLILGKSVVSEEERAIGKQLNFASVYGAQAEKIGQICKISKADAEKFLSTYFKKLPGVTSWINRVKYDAHQKQGVKTLFGRFIPLPKINTHNRYDRMHWERVAVNSIIQGSAAELMKLSLIKLREAGYSTVLTVHDEFVLETDAAAHSGMGPTMVAEHVQAIMENVVKLSVPIKADVGIGSTWAEAKE